jgi:serine/threonine protein kinase
MLYTHASPHYRRKEFTGKKDKYIVDKLISTGGMGNVYLTYSLRNNKKVVVKEPILNHPDGLGNVRLQKLKNEAKILNDYELINHRNIVSYIDESEDESNFFLVLEYVDGLRMKDYIRHQLPKEDALSFIEILLKVISFLHKKEILHRDINPKNIILRRQKDGLIKLEDFVLIDFGIAKRGLSSSVAEDGPVGGTRGWSAPEQFSSRFSYPSSDIYSVGCLLFYLLTGLSPYPNYINENGVIFRSEVKRFLSNDMEKIIKVATNPDPINRYQTAEDMLDALRGADIPSLIMPTNKIYRLRRITEIGRAHTCDQSCHSRGFFKHLDLPLEDPKKYISKHHARIYVEPNGKTFIIDLGSLNKTAKRQGNEKFQVLMPNRSYELKDGDEIAIVYNEKLGPYIKLIFKKGKIEEKKA